MKFKVDDKVIVVAGDSGIKGMVGMVVSLEVISINVMIKVRFDKDVGKYTFGGGPGKDIIFSEESLEHFNGITEEEFISLADIALDTKDKAWFEELLSRKNESSEWVESKKNIIVFDEGVS